MSTKYVTESDLAQLAKNARLSTGKKQIEVAREMKVKSPSVHHAEVSPHLPYTKLRCRMIEAYSGTAVSGPYYRLEKKTNV